MNVLFNSVVVYSVRLLFSQYVYIYLTHLNFQIADSQRCISKAFFCVFPNIPCIGMLLCLHESTSFVTFYSSQPHLRSFKNNKLTKSNGRRNKKQQHTQNIIVYQYSHSFIQNIDAMVFYSEHSLHRRLTNEKFHFFCLSFL